MAAFVDAKNAVVRDGDAAWPFDIDCRDGVARIALDDNLYVVRPLAWREKRNLARFAHLGEHFLQTQFLRVSLNDGGKNLSTTEESRSVLSALARWINAPDGDFGLPLDQQLLASVTLDICRSLQLGPDMFNTLDASEVELLWQATRATQPLPPDATPTAEPGMTRIVVIPGKAHSSNEQPDNMARDNDDAATPVRSASAAPEMDLGKISKPPLRPTSSHAETTKPATESVAISEEAAAEPAGQSSLLAGPVQLQGTQASSSMASGRQRAQSSGPSPNRFRVDFSTPQRTVSAEQTAVQGDTAVATAPPLRGSTSAREDFSPTHQASTAEHPAALTTIQRIRNPQQMAAKLDIAPALVPQKNNPTTAPQLADISLPPAAAMALKQSEALPQLADYCIAEFGARLDEAAQAAGIELEN